MSDATLTVFEEMHALTPNGVRTVGMGEVRQRQVMLRRQLAEKMSRLGVRLLGKMDTQLVILPDNRLYLRVSAVTEDEARG